MYASQLGELVLTSDRNVLTGVWYPEHLDLNALELVERADELPILLQTRRWLDDYFAGHKPSELPKIRLEGTPFQLMVWELLQEIPYGATTTYGSLATRVAQRMGRAHMSAQAIGGAVASNPISILVPCHRVVGANGRLTGYAGGLERKCALLEREGVELACFADYPARGLFD